MLSVCPTVSVLFFVFLTLFSTFILLEKYGARLLIWRAGSSVLLSGSAAMGSAGFEWAGELNTLSVLLIFLCGGVLVSLLTACIFDILARVAGWLKRSRAEITTD